MDEATEEEVEGLYAVTKVVIVVGGVTWAMAGGKGGWKGVSVKERAKERAAGTLCLRGEVHMWRGVTRMRE